MEYRIVNGELCHYGLKGMKWGTRRWQYYDGRFNEAGKLRYFGQASSNVIRKAHIGTGNSGLRTEEKSKNRYKKSEKETVVNSDESNKHSGFSKGERHIERVLKRSGNNKLSFVEKQAKEERQNVQKTIGVSDEDAEKIRRWAKIAGISLVTAAGLTAAAYVYTHRPQLIVGFHNDRGLGLKAVKLGEKLFNNARNGDDYIGELAKSHGYGKIGKDVLERAISSPTVIKHRDLNALAKNCIQNQRITGVNRFGQEVSDGTRRLSCWSGSNSYFFSVLTGGDFVSKSFGNLVDFNDFGKLYTEMPQVFTAFGTKAKTFVGKFGKFGVRAGKGTSKSLVRNILRNVGEGNNLSPDGKTTVGFINGAYHSCSCTHQFNFDMKHLGDGAKNLFITDTYDGSRYAVGTMLKNGSIKYNSSGIAHLTKELRHFNADSIRFYAPKLESVNLEMLSEVILGKIV